MFTYIRANTFSVDNQSKSRGSTVKDTVTTSHESRQKLILKEIFSVAL